MVDAAGTRATTKRRERRKTLVAQKKGAEAEDGAVAGVAKTVGKAGKHERQKEATLAAQVDLAKRYLKTYHAHLEDPASASGWKFNKHTQIWLMHHAFDASLVHFLFLLLVIGRRHGRLRSGPSAGR